MTEYILARQGPSGVRLEMDDYFDDAEIVNLYQWLDGFDFTRRKKNIGQDFSDGVLVAEIIKHYFPRLVQLHNYTPAMATKQKMENWYILNRRVLKSLQLDLSDDIIRALANGKQRVVEKVLIMLRDQLDKALERARQMSQRLHGHHGLAQSTDNLDMLLTPRGTASSHGSQQGKPYKYKSPRQRQMINNPARVSFNRPLIAPVMDNVPQSLVDEKEQECVAKNETIQIMNAKIRRLEHLLSLKDVRINDLEGRLNTLQDAQVSQFTTLR